MMLNKVGKVFKNVKRANAPISAQILSAFAFAAALALAFAAEPTDPTLEQQPHELHQVHARWKRDLTDDLLDSTGKFGGYLRKFKKLLDGTPPTVKEAFLDGDFSNITENDIKQMNVSVLEYVPTSIFSKISGSKFSLLSPIIEKFLNFDRPNALGRLMSAAGDKFDFNTLIDKVKENGGTAVETNSAAGVLLYNALNKLGDKDEITISNLRNLAGDGLLQLVPEEQLMKVKDQGAAKYLLNSMYKKPSDGQETDDVDDKALIYSLVNAAYGKAGNWTSRTLTDITPQILSQLPSSTLRDLNPDVVSQSIASLRNTKFDNPIQGKTIADIFLEKSGVRKDEEGVFETEDWSNLNSIMSSLGGLAAFVNPAVSTESSVSSMIINACDKLNLPAPILAVKNFVKSKTQGKKFSELGAHDVKEMGIAVLKNGPPELMNQAIKTGSLDLSDLQDIGSTRTESSGLGNSFLQGLISQVAGYAVKYFTNRGRIDFSGLPGAFMGALGIKGINNMANRDIENALEKLRNNPDALDDSQKALLLKKMKDADMLDSDSPDLPPALRALLPRAGMDKDKLPAGILDGLPSDAELRLAHGQGKTITAKDLARDPFLVGTLTPKQVEQIDLSEIPAVLAAVRKSKDGPQPQTLKALANRFRQYIQEKSDDYDLEDKKILKHITAAEVSKLPATVLAYFIDPRQTKKLPADVRKEIMIALGELSTKDHATIPAKTREEIILQGLAALDEKLDAEKKLGVAELAAFGGGVADLPPSRIEQLTPVAVEQALEVISGTSDDDDDGLKQRACLTPNQKKAWQKKLEQIYGPSEQWDPATVTSLCCSLALLEEEKLHLVDKESLATCRCPSDEEPPSHLKELKKALNANCKHEKGVDQTEHKKVIAKVKSEIDLSDLESQIISGRRRRKRSDPLLNCYIVRITGSATPYDKEQLESIPDADMTNCLYELGKEPLAAEGIDRTLWEKLVRARGGVENISSTDFIYAGHILGGIRLEDVSKLDLSNPDIVSPLGRPLGLSKNTLEKLAARLEEKSGKSLQDFTAVDLITAKNILCGFAPEQLRQIKSEAFQDALPVLKNIEPSCELTRLSTLTTIAETVFGEPSKWTSADVRGVGTLINGVSDVTQIPPEAFLGVTATVASSLPESILSTLTAEQLKYLPRFSAQAMSDEQLNHLSDEGKNALDIQGPLIADSTSRVTLQFSVSTFATLVITAMFTHRIL